jgi:hypothetical protein
VTLFSATGLRAYGIVALAGSSSSPRAIRAPRADPTAASDRSAGVGEPMPTSPEHALEHDSEKWVSVFGIMLKQGAKA